MQRFAPAQLLHSSAAVTSERYQLAVILFHAAVLVAAWHAARPWWRDADRCRSAPRPWLFALLHDGARLAFAAALAAVVAPALLALPALERISKSSATGRLLGEALFGEGVLFVTWLAHSHWRAQRPARGAVLGSVAVALLGAYWEGYHREPRLLAVRHHVVDRAPAEGGSRELRILHLTDIQTPAIGEHEARAFREGMARSPDLIVMTGDYVQDELGRETEARAARDLRALMARTGFAAPLGVFATEGDAGPSCLEVFGGTTVQCLVDASVAVRLPDGGSISITGLSGRRGRERSSAWLRGLLETAPPARHRVVISHSPDFVDALTPSLVDLVLAGHTHGGQVVVPFFGPLYTASRLPRRYAGGLNDFRGIPLHVSRGVGMERGFAPQVRFLCPPEICVVDVRFRTRDGGRVASLATGASGLPEPLDGPALPASSR